mmetsp:Transcript_11962/g.32280  ORF Transcript_11962/g.32280 Transcript_11962/m.32280 type:complete len:212 (+) Transcript_11962:1125-1760(+)
MHGAAAERRVLDVRRGRGNPNQLAALGRAALAHREDLRNARAWRPHFRARRRALPDGAGLRSHHQGGRHLRTKGTARIPARRHAADSLPRHAALPRARGTRRAVPPRAIFSREAARAAERAAGGGLALRRGRGRDGHLARRGWVLVAGRPGRWRRLARRRGGCDGTRGAHATYRTVRGLCGDGKIATGQTRCRTYQAAPRQERCGAQGEGR